MPAGKGTYGNKVGRPRNKRTGEDFLDREQKKKFNYKESKAELDQSMSDYRKGLKEAQEKDRKERERRKREADAKKFVEAEEKKRMKKHGIKRTANKAVRKK
tara:strand:- start:45 stop:350 length:306 start_codon:yes stop_codon:yes gene_type:complete